MGRKRNWKKSTPIDAGGDNAWQEDSDTYIVDDSDSEWQMEQLLEQMEREGRALEDETV
jgi:hypothetical protein